MESQQILKKKKPLKVLLNREAENLSLYTIIGSISDLEKNKKNKTSSWQYGYNPDYDVVVISKSGKIGDVININGLKIALPLQPKKVESRSKKQSEQYWEAKEYPRELFKIKTVFQWNDYSSAFKETWVDYIEQEFERRENGYWFKVNEEFYDYVMNL